jgi:hypothetical protein
MDGKLFSESVVHFYELYEQHASLFAPRKVTFELAVSQSADAHLCFHHLLTLVTLGVLTVVYLVLCRGIAVLVGIC